MILPPMQCLLRLCRQQHAKFPEKFHCTMVSASTFDLPPRHHRTMACAPSLEHAREVDRARAASVKELALFGRPEKTPTV